MKKMRRLIPAIAMLLVSAVMLSTASFAWFTISNSAQVSGMEVTATAGSSLLIVDAKAGGLAVGDFTAANGILSLTGVENPLQPATSVDGVMNTISDTGVVDPATGKAPTEVGLTTTGVTEANNYYYDYVVAIGAAGTEVNGTLTATVDVDAFTKVLHNAVSIDFLMATTTDGVPGTPAYVADSTIHFADSANGANDLVVDLGEVTVPLTIVEEALGEYIVVVMRVYFDGALDNAAEPGTTYVRNAYATEDPIGFDVKFEIN